MSNFASVGIYQWLLNHLVQDVPDEMLACESFCRKPQCSGWETCLRRLDCAAAMADKDRQIQTV